MNWFDAFETMDRSFRSLPGNSLPLPGPGQEAGDPEHLREGRHSLDGLPIPVVQQGAILFSSSHLCDAPRVFPRHNGRPEGLGDGEQLEDSCSTPETRIAAPVATLVVVERGVWDLLEDLLQPKEIGFPCGVRLFTVGA